jgi:23S rRNA (cytidine1920-2'-O)/16S rRNA (cytidine1409-2'-O)-methyltransferase
LGRKVRLDRALVLKGLVGSREEARELILAGKVRVAGRPVLKPSTFIDSSEQPVLLGTREYVSRGGVKLAGALDALGVKVEGRLCLDVGSSTGGFVDCLLSRGARAVVAVDVGRGLLHPRLRGDPRVFLLEGENARYLQPEKLPFAPELVTADLSFISLTLVLPALRRVARPDAEMLLLVKPEFEAGRGQVPGGVVRDPEVQREAVMKVVQSARSLGLGLQGVSPSVLRGPKGNREFFVLLSAGADRVRPAEAVDAAVRGGVTVGGSGGGAGELQREG